VHGPLGRRSIQKPPAMKDKHEKSLAAGINIVQENYVAAAKHITVIRVSLSKLSRLDLNSKN